MADRRAFVGGLLAAALAPRALVAAGAGPRVVGYLSGGQGPGELNKAMADLGWVAGREYRLEMRIPADWNPPTLTKAAMELVALRPDALLAYNSNRVAALVAATRTIPIVCGGMPDPVGAGFAQSLRRPGGNVTGLSYGLPESAGIVFGLLKMLRPALRRVAIAYPVGMPIAVQLRAYVAAARKASVEWVTVELSPTDDIEALLLPLASQALFIAPFRDVTFSAKILAIATRLRIAVLGNARDGALMEYGLEHDNAIARVAAILVKVLRGANPAEIPFELPDRPAFVLNRATARAIGVTIPPEVLLRVTELID
jgi:putative ABC transport system substrate-binding protein